MLFMRGLSPVLLPLTRLNRCFVTRQSVWYLVHNGNAKEYYMNNKKWLEEENPNASRRGDCEGRVCHS